jgi:uncharacterized alpha-E superfamily protein
MLSRVAEELFWLSRYVERAVAVARLIDVTLSLELDVGDAEEDAADLWAPLLGPASAAGEGGNILSHVAPDGNPTPKDVRDYLAFERENSNSLISCIQRARSAARGVREAISSEMWEQLNTLSLSLADSQREAEEDPYSFFRRVREGCQFFHGLADCTLAQDDAWRFITLGKFLERAGSISRVIYLQAHLLTMPDPTRARGTGLGVVGSTGDPTVRWLAVLRSCGCAEAYARYYSLRVEPARVVEFLLLNPRFPQSVRFSLGAAWDALRQIHEARSSPATASPEVRALGLLRARLEHAAVDEILEEGLDAYLADVQQRIVTVSDHVTRIYMRDEPQPGRLVAVTRAALIMAAQQQQQ